MRAEHVPGRRSRAWRRLFAAIAPLVPFVLVACGDGDGGGDERAARPAAGAERARVPEPVDCREPDPGVTPAALTVGALYPSTGSGPEQFFAATGAGMRARFDEANRAGGIGGRQLRLVPADDGDGEQANGRAARHLVEDEEVFGVIEVSTNAEGSGSYLHEQGVPVTGWAITPAFGAYENFFGYHQSTSPLPDGEPTTRSARFLAAHGATNLAIVAGGAAASVNVANQLAVSAPALGIEVGFLTTDVATGAEDFGVEVQAMLDAGVDALYTGMGTLPNIALYRQAVAAGLDLEVVLFPAGYDTRLASAYGADLEGVFFSIDWRPFELPVPAHETFRQALARVAPEEFPGQVAMVGWLSADTFIRGLEAAGAACPTREAFIANLRLVDDYTAGDLVPPTDFSEQFGRMPLCHYVVQLRDGAFVPVDDEPICGVLLADHEG